MKWRSCWPETVLALLVVALECWSSNKPTSVLVTAWPTQRKLASRERVRDLWYHGFENYMTHAFPQDELAPLSCKGRGPDFKNPHNWSSNDVAGNFSLTLVDVVDTFVILNDSRGFDLAVKAIVDNVSFDVDTKPQVFETTIRVLGGLLSGHIFASRPGPFYLPWYDGQLLALAHDLGRRLLPAFATPTGIPYARVNLRSGVPRGETLETCTAGAGSLILEFATLSRLTGDDRFEKVAYKAFFALWNRKSDIGLVGNTINVRTGSWSQPEISGIGAGIDSFYEYALKWYVLSGEVEFLDVWHDSYAAVMQYSRATNGLWFKNVNIHTGEAAYHTVDSLSSFWPGLQILAGDVENAVKSHLIYWNLWQKFSGMPEVWDMRFTQATSFQYPLRPEFAESTWYLYRATHDPFYLDVGERILGDIEARAKVTCGLAGIRDLRTSVQDDRMESFVLSETLKYLYLLFDETNPLHADDSNYVFTTEGHLLSLENKHLKQLPAVRRRLRGAENLQCAVYTPSPLFQGNNEGGIGLRGGVRSRPDVDYARLLVDGPASEKDQMAWSPYGYCDVPKGDLYSYDFILSHNGNTVPEDLTPDLHKLTPVPDGFVLNNVTGIRVHIVSRLGGKGYAITRLGSHSVRSGQIVYINDRQLILGPLNTPGGGDPEGLRKPVVHLRFSVENIDPLFQIQADMCGSLMETTLTAFTSLFGGDPTISPPDQPPLRLAHHEGVRIVQDKDNHNGCHPYTQTFPGNVLVVQRGVCTFLEKLLKAKEAGASGVVVFSDVDQAVNPTASEEEITIVGDSLDDVALVLLPHSSAQIVMDMIDTTDRLGFGHVVLTVEPEPERPFAVTNNQQIPTGTGRDFLDDQRVLFLNGHPLTNTRLLV